MPKLDIPALQKAVSENRYFITTHAKQRMGFRQVSDEDVKRVILSGCWRVNRRAFRRLPVSESTLHGAGPG